jgi:uncharacterized protein YfaT (DUF1175 family)
MPRRAEQEQEHDQQFLKQMGISDEKLVYPEKVLTEEERQILQLRWLAIMARS